MKRPFHSTHHWPVAGAPILFLLCSIPILLAAVVSPATGAPDLALADFPGRNYGKWTMTGTAFRPGPIRGERLLGKLEIENAGSGAVISSEFEGDSLTGTLTSPEFRIARGYISFLIGGGDYERDTCINLLVRGKVLHSATGWRSDHLSSCSWDVSALRGQKARLQIVDQASGDWGHINVARIVQTDRPARLPEDAGPLYGESLRPQFHFTARQWTMNRLNPRERQEGWINDLNGLIYYEGEYHLFAQRWAKCWLHAVSQDLVHWTELEPAFWEERLNSGVQSGTCVIDYHNSSGLSPNPKRPPMVAFWSRFDNRSQCISYSLDGGRSWKHYEKNPIMVRPERDPKVFWYAPGRHWVMMMYGENQYHILTSTNLLNWKDERHPVADSFECPDLFELPLDGRADQKRWVLIQGSGNYSLGRFDGTRFEAETDRYACDIGDFYATQTWGNVETGDGRRIQAAWMRFSNFPDMPFSQQVTFPCELTLRSTPAGPRLFREPVREIALLHEQPDTWSRRTLAAGQALPLEPAGRLFHIRAELEIPEGARVVINIRGIPVTLTARALEESGRQTIVTDRVRSVEFLVDRASIETFVNRGEISCSRFVLPKASGLSLKAEGGPVTVQSLVIWPLRSAWDDQRGQ